MDELRILLKLDNATILKIMNDEPVTLNVEVVDNLNLRIDIELDA